MINYFDILKSDAAILPEIKASIDSFLLHGQYILGESLENFEDKFASYVGAKYAVGVANGLDALYLTLLSLGVGPGDEVIVPSNTYIATWLAVTHSGAKIVPVEPEIDSMSIDPALIERAITSNTKAVLSVHLYGCPVDIDMINDICSRHGIYHIDDAAQAHGSEYKGKRIGSLTRASCWSFYPSKNLGAYGDGGMVTTSDLSVFNQIRMLRNYGSVSKYVNKIIGFNSRLDPIQASILSVKLDYLDSANAVRQAQAFQYDRGLNDLDAVRVPYVKNCYKSCWHIYPLRAKSRDRLQKFLLERGITTLIHYPIPPHMQEAYKSMNFSGLHVASAMSEELISLPIGSHLRNCDIETVISAIRNFYEHS